MTEGGGACGGELPRIVIERTPANDVYLVLTGLGLGPEAEKALVDPVGFMAANRAEVRTVAQLIQARVEAAGHRPGGTAAPVPAATAPACRTKRPPARDEAGRPVRPGRSLLR